MERPRSSVSSGTPWEQTYGYTRAVRIGSLIEVSGTVAADGSTVFAPGDAGEQTLFILKKIEKALDALGASLQHVVRTRMYVTDMTHSDAVGRAHGKVFGNIRPATTMVAVKALIAPEFLVEIEATAWVGDVPQM
ncbi:MAG: RidA family protein [Chitinophagales bacterium]